MKNLIQLSALLLLLVTASCSEKNEPVEDLPAGLESVTDIELFDTKNNSNAADIRVFFTDRVSNKYVLEYRVLLNPTNEPYSYEESLLFTDNSFSKISGADSNFKTNLNTTTVDCNGNSIKNDLTYYIQIISIPVDNKIRGAITDGQDSISLSLTELKDLYISSSSTHSVQVYDGVTGEFKKDFVPTRSGGLGTTQEVLFGKDGNLYVSGLGNQFIKKYNGQTGAFLEDFTSGYILDAPTKMAFGPDGHLYVSQWGQTHALVRFDSSSGEYIDTVIPFNERIMGQAWDSEGNLFVTSFGNNDVHKYGTDLKFISNLIDNTLLGPVNLWVNQTDNRLYIEDWRAGDIKVFDMEGNYHSTYISGLVNVEGHAYRDGVIYVCDWSKNEVLKFDSASGNFIGQHLIDSRLNTPNSIAFGPSLSQ